MNFVIPIIVLGIFRTDGVSSYITSSPSGGYAPWKHNPESSFAKPPSNVDLNDIFQEEYNEWAKRYGKSTSDERFENFKLNFMLQMQHNKKTAGKSTSNLHKKPQWLCPAPSTLVPAIWFFWCRGIELLQNQKNQEFLSSWLELEVCWLPDWQNSVVTMSNFLRVVPARRLFCLWLRKWQNKLQFVL